jgi:sorting nexin-1/2
MCAALARLANVSRLERSAGEDQAKADVTQLLNLADEYVRLIASVRLAFAARVRAYHAAQAADKEVHRVRRQREKDRAAGRLGDRAATSMSEIQEAERRARDVAADFEAQTRLVKSEVARFERERIEEFRATLSAHLDDQVARQAKLVTAWEEYHAVLLAMVKRAQQQQREREEA